jgi:hypothetical protein
MEDPSSDTQIIPLGRMPQQASVREARDDWTGVIDRKVRRKLQNRLNQRRFRTYLYPSNPKSGMSNVSLLARVEKAGQRGETA